MATTQYFLTAKVDPDGNNSRSITTPTSSGPDSCRGMRTSNDTVTYADTNHVNLITTVTDPFGRYVLLVRFERTPATSLMSPVLSPVSRIAPPTSDDPESSLRTARTRSSSPVPSTSTNLDGRSVEITEPDAASSFMCTRNGLTTLSQFLHHQCPATTNANFSLANTFDTRDV